MSQVSHNHIFGFLLTVWTVIFAAFWGVIYIGGAILMWVAEHLFMMHGEAADVFIRLLQNIGTLGLASIWAMGAVVLFVLRRWMKAITFGPGRPQEVEIQHEGQTIEASYQDVTEKR